MISVFGTVQTVHGQVILRLQKQILRTLRGTAFSGLNERLKNGSFNEIMLSIYNVYVYITCTFICDLLFKTFISREDSGMEIGCPRNSADTEFRGIF